MDTHLIVLFAEEKYVSGEYKCHPFVKFKHCIKSPFQESPEGIKIIQIRHYYLILILMELMICLKHINVMRQIQVLPFCPFIEFLIYIFDYFFGYHSLKYLIKERGTGTRTFPILLLRCVYNI